MNTVESKMEWQACISVESAGNLAVETPLKVKRNDKRACPWKVQVI